MMVVESMLSISIGVCVYNEEKNIRNLLNSLLHQRTTKFIKEIIVVSSACSDKTDEIIENEFLNSNPKTVLLKQKNREGKASAINLFLEHAIGDIIVLESGDTIPKKDTIEHLTEPFKNPKIGMTGGHPIPVNDPNTFMGFTVHLLWELHHKLALENPKLGELVAFRRNLVQKIPTNTAVDEAFIEALIKEQGCKLIYVPEAVVYNKGPENVSDFLKQRRRIFTGHIHLKGIKGYEPSSMKKLRMLKLIIKAIKFNPKQVIWTLGCMFLEFYGRALGSYDFYIKKENPFIWNIAVTTKSHIPEITHEYNPDAYPASAAQRINFWSMIQRQQMSSKTEISPELSYLPDADISSSDLSVPLVHNTPRDEIQKSNDKINQLIRLVVPFIFVESIGLIANLFDLFNVSG